MYTKKVPLLLYTLLPQKTLFSFLTTLDFPPPFIINHHQFYGVVSYQVPGDSHTRQFIMLLKQKPEIAIQLLYQTYSKQSSNKGHLCILHTQQYFSGKAKQECCRSSFIFPEDREAVLCLIFSHQGDEISSYHQVRWCFQKETTFALFMVFQSPSPVSQHEKIIGFEER